MKELHHMAAISTMANLMCHSHDDKHDGTYKTTDEHLIRESDGKIEYPSAVLP
jgi:hypothetical protein